MISPTQRTQLAKAIDSFVEFRGSGIGFYADGTYQSLRNSNHTTGLHTLVVLEEVKRKTAAASAFPGGTASPPPESPGRRLGPELLGSGLNCLAMVLSGAAVCAESLSSLITAVPSVLVFFITNPIPSPSALPS